MHLLVSWLRVVVNAITFCLMRIHGCTIKTKGKCTARLNNHWSVKPGSTMNIGYHLSTQDHCRFLVRGGTLKIGDNVGFNSNCIIACHERITIDDGTEIGPNTCIYDHDHDYKCEGGIKAGQYLTAPVSIGKNVWIGANVVILRGTEIGDNCVIAAGSVVKGNVPANTLLYTERTTKTKNIRSIDV